jgi:hypothetical protein
MLTLSKALESGRLQEFIAQAEANGVGPAHHSLLVVNGNRFTAASSMINTPAA